MLSNFSDFQTFYIYMFFVLLSYWASFTNNCTQVFDVLSNINGLFTTSPAILWTIYIGDLCLDTIYK